MNCLRGGTELLVTFDDDAGVAQLAEQLFCKQVRVLKSKLDASTAGPAPWPTVVAACSV